VPSHRRSGNARADNRDNRLVRIIAELMDVIRDLCGCSAAFSLLGEHAWAAALVEQCAELLAYRARLLAKLRADGALRGSSLSRGREWTN
jgi:hypothetical protein